MCRLTQFVTARYLIWSMLPSALLGCAIPGAYPSRQIQSQPTMMMQRQAALLPRLTPEEWATEFRRFAAAVPPEYAPAVATQSVTIEGQSGGPPITLSVVRITFPDRVFFDFAVDRPRPEAGPLLDMIATDLTRSPSDTAVTVLGHTDSVGSDAYNIDLSRRRAFGVMQALVIRGANLGALSIVAVGKQQPVASNETEEGRARNRRVEFLVSPRLAANLTAVQYTASEPNAVVDVYSLRSGDNRLDLAPLGPLALLSPGTARPAEPAQEGITPATLEVDPTIGDPNRIAPRSPSSSRSAVPALPPNVSMGASADPTKPAATAEVPRAKSPAPAPHYELRPLEPGVELRQPGPEISY
jgi:outer membrane protein OmpA-like peptidoglycan-associated protein